MIKKFTVGLIVTTLFLAGCKQNHLELVRDGKSDFTIIIPVQHVQAETRAAELLQKYLEAVSGCRLEIKSADSPGSRAIVIRENGEMKNDGFRIFSKGGSLFIEGSKNSKGCVYGAVDILESLGIRVLSPQFRIIPKSRDISLPVINTADSSVNRKRFVLFYSSEYSNDKDLIDFLRLSEDGSGIASHSYEHLVPSSKYYKTHPEYYALRDGKRITSQLCLSNKEVVRVAVETLREDLKANPEMYYLHVAQNDDDKYCMCDECLRVLEEEKSPSGSVIRFANEIAREFPDKMILTLAYQYSRSAPAKVRPLPNVQITLCSIELNRSCPIAEDTSIQSRSFAKDITDWGRISKNIYLYDYTINFHNYLCPFPNIHVRQPNIKFFVDNNVFNHFQQSSTRREVEFADLKLYLTARLLWNPEVNTEVVIDEFLTGYYGKAAPWIRKYIDRMQEELVKSGKRLDIFAPLLEHEKGYLSEKNLNEYSSLFDKAEEAVKDDETFLRHVQLARLPLYVALLETGKYNIISSRGWYANTSAARNPRLDDVLEKFYAVCQREKIEVMNEQGYTVEKYYKSIKRAAGIDHILKGNYALNKKVKASPEPNVEPGYGSRSISKLTDAVLGDDYSHEFLWVGWEGTDFELLLDLEKTVKISFVELNTFRRPNQWERVLHPESVECLVSDRDDTGFISLGKKEIIGTQSVQEPILSFIFEAGEDFPPCRYVKLKVKGTRVMPDYFKDCAGQPSRVFIDEIIVR